MKTALDIIIEFQPQQIKLLWGYQKPSGFAAVSARVDDIKGLTDAQISKLLHRLWGEAKIKSSSATIMLSRRDILVRYLLLPSQKDDEIRQMVSMQILKHIPFTQDEVVVDHLVLSKETTGYSWVMVLAVESATAMRYWKLAHEAGIWIDQLTVGSLGVPGWFSLKETVSNPDGVEAYLIIDSLSAEVIVGSQGQMIFSRAFDGANVAKDQDRLPELIEQVEASFRQYRKDCVWPMPLRLIVVAQEESSVVIIEKLRQHLSIPVERLERFPPRWEIPGVTKELLAELCLPHAAMQMKGRVSVNLIPWAAQEVKSNQDRRVYLVRIAVLAFFVLLALWCVFNVVTLKRSWFLAQLNAQIKKTKVQIKELEPKLHVIRSMEDFLNKRLVLSRELDVVSSALPANSLLTMMSIDKDRVVVLQGMSRRASDVNNFQKNLLATGKFENIRLDFVNKTYMPEGEVSVFQITCQILP